jgi:hypothetical protein
MIREARIPPTPAPTVGAGSIGAGVGGLIGLIVFIKKELLKGLSGL